MKSKIEFRDAMARDDAQLTRLISAPLPGDLSLTFCRQPSYLAACAHCGPARQVLTALDGERVVALCSYFSRDYFWSDRIRSLQIISDFRALPQAAGKSITGRGWGELRRRLNGQPALISLLRDNPRAQSLFSKRRAGWPTLSPIGDLCTNITPLVSSGIIPTDLGPYHVRALSGSQVVSFVNRQAAERPNGSPQVQLSDFGSVLPAEDRFWGVFEGAELRGCAGLWQPTAYRQTRIHSYAGLYLGLHRLTRRLGLPLLPEPGTEIAMSYATLLRCPQPAAFRALFRVLKADARQRGARFLVWCRSESEACHWWDRLRFRYHSRLYQLLWDDDQPLPPLKNTLGCEVAWL